jgi:IMP dehydrogenase
VKALTPDTLEKLSALKASDIMVPDQDIITASEYDKIREIETVLLKKDIGGVPIVRMEEGRKKIVGMLTQRDIVIAREAISTGGMCARDLMSRNLVMVTTETELLDILKIMRDNDVERLPVIDGEEILVGIINHRDILNKVLETIESTD